MRLIQTLCPSLETHETMSISNHVKEFSKTFKFVHVAWQEMANVQDWTSIEEITALEPLHYY